MILVRKVFKDKYDKGEQFGSIFSFKIMKFEFDIDRWTPTIKDEDNSNKRKFCYTISISYNNLYDIELVNNKKMYNQLLEDYKNYDWMKLLYKRA